jgi:hypothetical protein
MRYLPPALVALAGTDPALCKYTAPDGLLYAVRGGHLITEDGAGRMYPLTVPSRGRRVRMLVDIPSGAAFGAAVLAAERRRSPASRYAVVRARRPAGSIPGANWKADWASYGPGGGK